MGQTHPVTDTGPSAELSVPIRSLLPPNPCGYPGHREAPSTAPGHGHPAACPAPVGFGPAGNDPAQTRAVSSPVPGDPQPPPGSRFISSPSRRPRCLQLSAWAAFCSAHAAGRLWGQHKLWAPAASGSHASLALNLPEQLPCRTGTASRHVCRPRPSTGRHPPIPPAGEASPRLGRVALQPPWHLQLPFPVPPWPGACRGGAN